LKGPSPAKPRRKDVLEHQSSSDGYATVGVGGAGVGGGGGGEGLKGMHGAPLVHGGQRTRGVTMGTRIRASLCTGWGIGITPYLGFVQQLLSIRRHKVRALCSQHEHFEASMNSRYGKRRTFHLWFTQQLLSVRRHQVCSAPYT